MSIAPVEVLAVEQAAAVASLVAMGAQSGATVLGLSGVRRTKDLRLIFVDRSISANTMQELGKLTRGGVRVMCVVGLGVITRRMGREDVQVLAVKLGPLAEGILKKLPASEGA